MSLKTAFDDVEEFFAKVFKSAPADTVAALSAINAVAPEAELLLALLDPAAAAVATPIITEVQADLGTVATMLKNGNITTVQSFFTAIKANLASLLKDGHITNPESVTKATAIVGAVTGTITSIQSQLGLAAA